MSRVYEDTKEMVVRICSPGLSSETFVVMVTGMDFVIVKVFESKLSLLERSADCKVVPIKQEPSALVGMERGGTAMRVSWSFVVERGVVK